VAALVLTGFAVGDTEIPALTARGHPEKGDCDFRQYGPCDLFWYAKACYAVQNNVLNMSGSAGPENLREKKEMMVTHETFVFQNWMLQNFTIL
jgi:hypothetical protein